MEHGSIKSPRPWGYGSVIESTGDLPETTFPSSANASPGGGDRPELPACYCLAQGYLAPPVVVLA